MSEFRFETPNWSTAIWVVIAVVGVLLWLEQRRGRAIHSFLSITMQRRLVSRTNALRRFSSVVLLGLAGICFVVALMRPQFGLTYVKTPRVGAQIMFCLDVSKSMLAEDVAPNRLERAKADITDLLTFLEGDQVGLIGFAGRASVLCPLTPDYGFFKMVLVGTGPASVGRGGTRLEEPLRKALSGFRSESDVSRVIFLITDGEDHDSHPLDVAKEAIEKGVKVVAVGLGDESGSEIRITDPRTGVQTQVMDADGNPVLTRLDGETLRELALETEGVYIPAGIGTLDLKSIYETHLRPLVRGEMQDEGRAIRRDAFQWAILAGMAFLLAGLIVSSGRIGHESQPVFPSSGPLSRTALLACLLLLQSSGGLLVAEEPDRSAGESASGRQSGPIETEQGMPSDPRQSYNRGLTLLRQDPDAAEELLIQARSEARGDGEVRFRSTYNMGWIEVGRADELIEDEPKKALEHLQRAAGWFRDAVRLRSDADDARHNLEVVLLRITQLRDQLAKRDEEGLANRLDAAIESEREIISKLRSLVQRVAASEDPNVADELRPDFQRLAVDQRVMLSDLQGLTEAASGELSSLEGKSESERTPEENLRIAQLVGVLTYVNQASQRLGQSRSQLRRRQAARGFRRAATGLNQLKRGRDQLREPLQIIDSILTDLTQAAEQTAAKALEKQIVGRTEVDTNLPAWIDREYLSETQTDLTDRTQELTTRLEAGLTDENEASAEDAETPVDPQRQDFLEQLGSAVPLLTEATDVQRQALGQIDLEQYDVAYQRQVRAVKALQLAREQFADLRTLIELAYGTQQEIGTALSETAKLVQPEKGGDGESTPDQRVESDDQKTVADAELIDQMIAMTSTRQDENLERMQRLIDTIEKELDRLNAETSAGAQALPDSDAPDQDDAETEDPEQQRMTLARVLALQASEQMSTLRQRLEGSSNDSDEESIPQQSEDDQGEEAEPDGNGETKVKPPLPLPVEDSEAAQKTLQELRRLFFTIVEHLRETAEKQAGLNDDTEQTMGVAAATESEGQPLAPQASELASRQTQLGTTAEQIAEVLRQQSEQAVPDDGTGEVSVDPQQQEMMRQNAERAGKAAQLVNQAQDEMVVATEQLTAETPELATARPAQDKALQKLIEALRELEPPQESNSEQTQQQEQQPSPQQNDQEEEQSQQQPSQSQDAAMDPSRVLQAVRDREAQRRRDQEKRVPAGQVPVERDW